jgi:hypothetical protein
VSIRAPAGFGETTLLGEPLRRADRSWSAQGGDGGGRRVAGVAQQRQLQQRLDRAQQSVVAVGGVVAAGLDLWSGDDGGDLASGGQPAAAAGPFPLAASSQVMTSRVSSCQATELASLR